MEDEKTFLNLLQEAIKAANRLADGIGKLVEEPMVEIESSPPQCPHCKNINPHIIIKPQDQAIEGPLIEFILAATCKNCGNTFYVIFPQWAIFGDKKSAFENGKLLIERVTGDGGRK